jgi:hypothetical protein
MEVSRYHNEKWKFNQMQGLKEHCRQNERDFSRARIERSLNRIFWTLFIPFLYTTFVMMFFDFRFEGHLPAEWVAAILGTALAIVGGFVIIMGVLLLFLEWIPGFYNWLKGY